MAIPYSSTSSGVSLTASGVQPGREMRQVEAAIQKARSMADRASNAISLLDDMRQRLLGLSEPEPPKGSAPEPVRSELEDLNHQLDRLCNLLMAIEEKAGSLQRV